MNTDDIEKLMTEYRINKGTTFSGKPCRKCGSTERFVKGSQRCYHCKQKLDRALYIRRKEAKLESNE